MLVVSPKLWLQLPDVLVSDTTLPPPPSPKTQKNPEKRGKKGILRCMFWSKMKRQVCEGGLGLIVVTDALDWWSSIFYLLSSFYVVVFCPLWFIWGRGKGLKCQACIHKHQKFVVITAYACLKCKSGRIISCSHVGTNFSWLDYCMLEHIAHMTLSLQIWKEEMQQVYLGKAKIPEEVDTWFVKPTIFSFVKNPRLL